MQTDLSALLWGVLVSDIDYAAIRARLAAATAGPWTRTETMHAESSVAVAEYPITKPIAKVHTDPDDYGRANAELIAHAPTDLARLLDRVEELEATVERVRSACETTTLVDDWGLVFIRPQTVMAALAARPAAGEEQ